MGVFAPIPLPKPGEGLAEGSDWMHKLLMAPVERREKEAKGQEASIKAQFLREILAGGGGGGGLGISRSEVARGMLGIPSQSPEEKEASELRVSKQREQNATDIKETNDIENSATDIQNTLDDIARAKEIFRKRPDLTGKLAGGLSKIGFSTDPDIATLSDIFGNIQVAKARIASTRGGSQAMSQVKEFKPDIMNQGPANVAMLTSMETALKGHLSKLGSRHKSKSGSDLDGSSGSSERTVKVVDDETGESMTIPISKAREMGVEGV